jgi:hypothetical protein
MANDTDLDEMTMRDELHALSGTVKVMHEKVSRVDSAVFGSPPAFNNGLLVRIDRIEAIFGQMRWILGVVAAAVVTQTAAMFLR